MATIVKRNLESWLNVKQMPLHDVKEYISAKLTQRRKSKTSKDIEAIRLKLVQAKLSDGDISGAIRILSSNETIAAVSVIVTKSR